MSLRTALLVALCGIAVAAQAAHLAVMLPNPRKYEKSYSARLQAHAERIQGRMRGSEVP